MVRLNPRIRVRFDESDLVQETLVKASDPSTPPCRGESERERLAWLEEIQNNLYIDRYRAEHAQKRDVNREQVLRDVLEQSTVHWEAELVDPGKNPVDEAARRELAVRVAEAIQQLNPDQRDAVIARGMLHLSLADAEKVIGKTEGAIAGLYTRGIKELKKLLRGLEGDVNG